MWYYPGDVVSVQAMGVIRHEGIITESGTIISNSRRRGGVFEESPRRFACGGKIVNHGALGSEDPDIVIARARARIGRSYDPVYYNCEHFVRECWGEDRRSPQKQLALMAAGALALLAIF